MEKRRHLIVTILNILLLIIISCVNQPGDFEINDSANEIIIKTENTIFQVQKQGFRFSFASRDGKKIVGAHPESGLLMGPYENWQPVQNTIFDGCSQGECRFSVQTEQGLKAMVKIKLTGEHAHLMVKPELPDSIGIVTRVAGASPGYGLADNAGWRPTTDITGYNSADKKYFREFRMVSNFCIYPWHGFAVVLIEPQAKIIQSNKQEIVQGVCTAGEITDLHFFFGSPKEIYKSYHQVRNQRAYPVMLPKYEFFGVGWEAFGALAMNTNQKTVTEHVSRYLELGYPLRWMVVGSGFWPKEDPRYHATTSFGLWDEKLYPDPRKMIDHFHDKGLKFFIGLRIAFITNGPFSEEGVEKRYFIEADGKAKVFEIGFPFSPVYLLDARNPEAVKWYLNLAKKWTDFGIDGFKEDLYGYMKYQLRDDKIDPVNRAMMESGLYIMGRNNYIGSPADIHRINDFNYDQDQDRGPINALAFAYSGFPLVYPDIVGGTVGKGHFDKKIPQRTRTYIMRNAQWASVHSSMSFGIAPWEFNDPQVEEVMLKAARLHNRLHPYIYSNAVKFYHDGYPWTFTPLPIAFPDDPNVYGRENKTVRGYQWMIGDALLATPLYGEDYDRASSRDVYLPKGVWIDYDTGEKYQGPTTLDDFPLPVGKTPLFVGGTGFVVELEEDQPVGRIYPVNFQGETHFWQRDAKTLSRIRIEVVDWESPGVVDLTTGEDIAGEWVRHAFQFEFQAGHDYKIH